MHTGNGEILSPAVKGRNAVILPGSCVSWLPLLPSTNRNGKCQTLIWIFHHYYGRQAHFGQTSPSLTTTRERGVLPKMGAKNATDFQKSVALLFGAVFNFSLPFPLLGKRKGQPILAILWKCVLCKIDKIKFEDHSSTKYLYAAASSSPHSLSKLPFSS